VRHKQLRLALQLLVNFKNCDVSKIPETVSHFLLICPKYRAQRETLLESLKKMGVNVNIPDILRHSDASRLVQIFVDETHRTI